MVLDFPVIAPPANGVTAPPVAGPPVRRAGADLRSVIELVGAVAAPTTLIGALALYFGVVYVNAQAFYFGIDGSTLGFSTQDYVLRSADALFVPLGALAVAGIALLAGHTAFRRWAQRPGRESLARAATWGLAVLGVGSFAAGATSVFRPLPFRTPFLFAPLCLGAGAIACAYSMWVRRELSASPPVSPAWVSTASCVLVGVLVVISLFWAASDYARALGRGRSAVLEATLPYRPGVAVYSDRPLQLEGGGVRAVELPAPGGEPRYRYDGLRLFIHSGGKYFLLPAGWTPAGGRALILPDDERVRIEFTVGGPS